MTEGLQTCPWCDRRVEGEAVVVGPPPHLSEHHRFRFHDRCLAEWHRFADRLFDLSRRGAGPTLVEYPRNHGPDDLIEPGTGRIGEGGIRPEASDVRPTER